jgi:hypothetical protein
MFPELEAENASATLRNNCAVSDSPMKVTSSDSVASTAPAASVAITDLTFAATTWRKAPGAARFAPVNQPAVIVLREMQGAAGERVPACRSVAPTRAGHARCAAPRLVRAGARPP